MEPPVWQRASIEDRLRDLEESAKKRDVAGAIASLCELIADYKPSANVLAVAGALGGLR